MLQWQWCMRLLCQSIHTVKCEEEGLAPVAPLAPVVKVMEALAAYLNCISDPGSEVTQRHPRMLDIKHLTQIKTHTRIRYEYYIFYKCNTIKNKQQTKVNESVCFVSIPVNWSKITLSLFIIAVIAGFTHLPVCEGSVRWIAELIIKWKLIILWVIPGDHHFTLSSYIITQMKWCVWLPCEERSSKKYDKEAESSLPVGFIA